MASGSSIISLYPVRYRVLYRVQDGPNTDLSVFGLLHFMAISNIYLTKVIFVWYFATKK